MSKHHINATEKARITAEITQFMIDNQPCTREMLLLEFPKHDVEVCEEDAREEAKRLSRRAA